MRNIAVTIRYDGRNYHGWQVQKNAITVQEVFQDALEKFLGERMDVKGCSRTDSGVHANMYVINFYTDSDIPCEKILSALNYFLPQDISAYKCEEKPESFHSRYSCTGKQYIYKIWNSRYRNPFYNELAVQYSMRLLNEKELNLAAQKFLGTRDYSAFCSVGAGTVDNVRTVKSASVTRNGDMVTFSVQADGFLYNMVRIMAGTLIAVAENKIKIEEIDDIIKSKDRSRAGITAPAHGLYLNEIFF